MSAFKATVPELQARDREGAIVEPVSSLDEAGKLGKGSREEITKEQYNERLLQGRALLVNMVDELRRFGQVSSQTWSNLQNIIGMDIQLVQTYLSLMDRVKRAMDLVKSAQERLKRAQEAYARALKKVRDIQDELRLFEIETADIPERYKRSRRTELELRIMAAQQQARAQQEAVAAAREQVSIAQEQLKASKEQLNVFKQMLTQLSQLAQAAAKAAVGSDDMLAWGEYAGDLDTTLEILEGRFKELWGTWEKAFAPVKGDLEYLSDFFRGLMGIPMPMIEHPGPRPPLRPETEAYGRGAALRGIFDEIGENASWVGEKFESIVGALDGILTWYEEQPEWLKGILHTGAIVIGINWLVGGVAGDIASGIIKMLVGTGLIVYAVGAAKGVTLAGVGTATAATAAFLLPVAIILGLSALASGPFADSIYKFFEGVQTRLSAAFPWFKVAVGEAEEFGPVNLWSPPGGIANLENTKAEGGKAGKSFLAGLGDSIVTGAVTYVGVMQDYIIDPLVGVFQSLYDKVAGHSIIPDMVDSILVLFEDMSTNILVIVDKLIVDMRTYLQIMQGDWAYYLALIRNDVIKLIYKFQQLLSLMAQVSTGGVHWSSNIVGYQHGGIVDKLQTALVHPGELILTTGMQKNVAMAIAGASPGRGFGAGAMSIKIDQSNWRFEGTPNKQEVKRLVREGTYEAVKDVVESAT